MTAHLTDVDDVFSRAELLARGFTRGEIDRALARGSLVCVSTGFYAPATLGQHSPQIRHQRWALAMLRSVAKRSALAHVSAATVHGLAIHDIDLSRVRLARDDTQARRGPLVSKHLIVDRRVPEHHVSEVVGARVTSVARTIADLARSEGVGSAVVAADSALQLSLTTLDEVHAVLSDIPGVGVARARRTLALVDGRSESPLESLSRLEIGWSGLPAPELQVTLCDSAGRFLGRVDFLWRESRVIGECDGEGKYLGVYGDRTAYETIAQERRRQQALVDEGWQVIRWTWRELVSTPEVVIARIRAALERARRVG